MVISHTIKGRRQKKKKKPTLSPHIYIYIYIYIYITTPNNKLLLWDFFNFGQILIDNYKLFKISIFLFLKHYKMHFLVFI